MASLTALSGICYSELHLPICMAEVFETEAGMDEGPQCLKWISAAIRTPMVHQPRFFKHGNDRPAPERMAQLHPEKLLSFPWDSSSCPWTALGFDMSEDRVSFVPWHGVCSLHGSPHLRTNPSRGAPIPASSLPA